MKLPLRFMSWQAYKYDRFRRLRRSLYPGDLRRLHLPVRYAGDSGAAPQFQARNPSSRLPEVFDAAALPQALDGLYPGSTNVAWQTSQPPTLLPAHASWALGDWPSLPDLFAAAVYSMQAGLLFNLKTNPPEPRWNLFLELESKSPPNLSLFADFLRDFFLAPWLCFLQAGGLSTRSRRWGDKIKELLSAPGNIISEANPFDKDTFPRLWVPSAYLYLCDHSAEPPTIPEDIPPGALKVLLVLPGGGYPDEVSPDWDLCLTMDGAEPLPACLEKPWQGWLASDSLPSLLNLLDMRVHAHHCRQIMEFITHPDPPRRRHSVVLSTYRRPELLRAALESLARQTLAPEYFEVIVVNNDPQDSSVRRLLAEPRLAGFGALEGRLRLIVCPLPGLSFARNAAIASASGQALCFLDDDATAHPDWLEQINRSFEEHARVGVMGGEIHLAPPEPRPKVLKAGLERFWTDFRTPFKEFSEVKDFMEFPWGANWCIRRKVLMEMGGFRTQYGRRKRDFSGGEELIAAGMAQKSGYAVAVLPAAVVDHHPEASRYTFSYLMRTIQAQIIIHYRLGRDLYLAQTVSAAAQAQGVGRFVARVFNLLKTPRSKRETLALEYLGYLLAWSRLFFERLVDAFGRLWNRF